MGGASLQGQGKANPCAVLCRARPCRYAGLNPTPAPVHSRPLLLHTSDLPVNLYYYWFFVYYTQVILRISICQLGWSRLKSKIM